MGAPAVIYRRISIEESSGLGLADQEARCRAYCEMRGLEVVEVVTDDGVSGGTQLKARAGGARLLDLTGGRRPKVRHVVALKLDRGFRNAGDALTVTADWDRRGVVFHLVDFGGASLDLSSAMGRMFLTLTAGFAELERGLCSERTRSALSVKRARGEFTGGEAPFGFHVEDGKLVEDEGEQRALALIVDLRSKGHTFEEIASDLNRRGVPNRGDGAWRRGRVHTLYRRATAA
ncbi:MAG TPA: recombinase family protein [Planctomycetota bacterium]|nr:recombinase family protein [Planctomycetota bacterium]